MIGWKQPLSATNSQFMNPEQVDEIDAIRYMFEGNAKVHIHHITDRSSTDLHGMVQMYPQLSVTFQLDSERHSINNFPPFHFLFTLPANYPSSASDSTPSCSVTCEWLPDVHLNKVNYRIQQIVQDLHGDPVLVSLLNFLHEDALKEVLHHPDWSTTCEDGEEVCVDLCRFVGDENASRTALQILQQHEAQRAHQTFLESVHECGVCSRYQLGQQSLLFQPCGHIFCRTCVRECYTLQVKEGRVDAFPCLGAACESLANPSQVRSVLDRVQLERIEQLDVQRALDSLADIVLCPRCQMAATVTDSRLAQCGYCTFAFCKICQHSYHGTNVCPIASAEEIAEDELNRMKPEARARLEEKLRHQRELMESEEFIAANLIYCPKCKSPVEKSGGCNKVFCIKCRTIFCYACGQYLSQLSNPYSHFSASDGSCPLFGVMVNGLP